MQLQGLVIDHWTLIPATYNDSSELLNFVPSVSYLANQFGTAEDSEILYIMGARSRHCDYSRKRLAGRWPQVADNSTFSPFLVNFIELHLCVQY